MEVKQRSYTITSRFEDEFNQRLKQLKDTGHNILSSGKSFDTRGRSVDKVIYWATVEKK